MNQKKPSFQEWFAVKAPNADGGFMTVPKHITELPCGHMRDRKKDKEFEIKKVAPGLWIHYDREHEGNGCLLPTPSSLENGSDSLPGIWAERPAPSVTNMRGAPILDDDRPRYMADVGRPMPRPYQGESDVES